MRYNNRGGYKVIHKENGGVSSARNAGLDVAKGEYIAFIDADDYVTEDYFEVLMADAEKYNADIVNCSCIEIEDGYTGALGKWFKTTKSNRLINKRETYFEDYFKADDWYGCVVWGKIIKRNLALSVRFENLTYDEDKLYMMRLFANGPITYLDTYKGYYYVRWKTSASMQANAGGDRRLKRLQDGIYARYQQLNMVKDFADKSMVYEYLKGYIVLIIHALIRADEHDKYIAEREKMLQYVNECLSCKHIGLKYRLMLGLYRLNADLYWNLGKIVLNAKGGFTKT